MPSLEDAKTLSVLRKASESLKKHPDEKQVSLQCNHLRFLIRLAGEATPGDGDAAELLAGFQTADSEQLAKLPERRTVPLKKKDFLFLLALAEKSVRGQKLVKEAPKEPAAPFDLSAVVRKHSAAARQREAQRRGETVVLDDEESDEDLDADEEGPPGS